MIPCTKLFDDNCQIVKLASIIFVVQKIPKSIHHNHMTKHFFPAWPVKPGVLNKDPTVWLNGVRPANTFILPSYLEKMPAQLHGTPTPKYTFASIK
jgi:hypothetical protein